MAVQVKRRHDRGDPRRRAARLAINQFTLWFGTNLQVTAIVGGALAVVFGADPLWAIVGADAPAVGILISAA